MFAVASMIDESFGRSNADASYFHMAFGGFNGQESCCTLRLLDVTNAWEKKWRRCVNDCIYNWQFAFGPGTDWDSIDTTLLIFSF